MADEGSVGRGRTVAADITNQIAIVSVHRRLSPICFLIAVAEQRFRSDARLPNGAVEVSNKLLKGQKRYKEMMPRHLADFGNSFSLVIMKR